MIHSMPHSYGCGYAYSVMLLLYLNVDDVIIIDDNKDVGEMMFFLHWWNNKTKKQQKNWMKLFCYCFDVFSFFIYTTAPDDRVSETIENELGTKCTHILIAQNISSGDTVWKTQLYGVT